MARRSRLWSIAKKLGRRLSLALFRFCRFFPVLLVISCATPAQRFQTAAAGYGFSSETFASAQFRHRLFLNAQARRNSSGEVLHVYLDGDGTPWEYGDRIADDPTPRNPVILDLMRADTSPALLLGRPCYYGFNVRSGCDSRYWTERRYSRIVVDSMAEVLRQWLQQHSYRRLVLIGYSGGGALAVLLAPYFDNAAAVLTVAANLDVAAWSRIHGYPTLKESLDPALLPPLAKHIRQVHAAGGDDQAVPQ